MKSGAGLKGVLMPLCRQAACCAPFYRRRYAHGRGSEHASTTRHVIGVLSLAASDFGLAWGRVRKRQIVPKQLSAQTGFYSMPEQAGQTLERGRSEQWPSPTSSASSRKNWPRTTRRPESNDGVYFQMTGALI
jgi:hypothetical protein